MSIYPSIYLSIRLSIYTEKKWFIEFTNFFKVSVCNQFILATFK